MENFAISVFEYFLGALCLVLFIIIYYFVSSVKNHKTKEFCNFFRNLFRSVFGSRASGSANSYLTRMNAVFYAINSECGEYNTLLPDVFRKRIMRDVSNRIDELVPNFRSGKITPELYIKKVIYNSCVDAVSGEGRYDYELMFSPHMNDNYFRVIRFLLKSFVKEGIITQEFADEQFEIISYNSRHGF